MNHFVIRYFLRNLNAERSWTETALEQAHKVTELLANFDLDSAEAVLQGSALQGDGSR